MANKLIGLALVLILLNLIVRVSVQYGVNKTKGGYEALDEAVKKVLIGQGYRKAIKDVNVMLEREKGFTINIK